MPLRYDGTLPPPSISAQLQLDPLVEVEAVEQFRHDVHVPGGREPPYGEKRLHTSTLQVRRFELSHIHT